jgi:hypothetical protein
LNRSESIESTGEGRGLSLQEKQAFILGTLPAMAQYTSGFICSVFGVSDSKMGRHHGSAFRCKLRGRRALLTALHVIEEAQKEPLGVAVSTAYGKPPYVVEGPVPIDQQADIAVYFLPDDYPCPDTFFWPSARIDHSLEKLATDYLFLHGFPGKRSYPSLHLGGVINKSLPYGAMQRLENLPPDLEPFQFAIEYDPQGMIDETGIAGDLVDPHGLSGSPVWRIGASGRSRREWSPSDSLLVGIVTQWRPDEKVLVATSANRLPPDW